MQASKAKAVDAKPQAEPTSLFDKLSTFFESIAHKPSYPSTIPKSTISKDTGIPSLRIDPVPGEPVLAWRGPMVRRQGVAILPPTVYSSATEILAKVYSTELFERAQEEWWEMVLNEPPFEALELHGLKVNLGITFSEPSETNALRGEERWSEEVHKGKLLVLGHEQLRLLDTHLLRQLASMFRITEIDGKSRRQLEKALLAVYQVHYGQPKTEVYTIGRQPVFAIPTATRFKAPKTDGEPAWHREEDCFLNERIPRLQSSFHECTTRVIAWIDSFLALNPAWRTSSSYSPITSSSSSEGGEGTQIWKLASIEHANEFHPRPWYVARSSKACHKRWEAHCHSEMCSILNLSALAMA